jgi:hypothetical protein
VDGAIKAQLALVAVLLWLTGALCGALGWSYFTAQRLDALGEQVLRASADCEAISQRLSKCDSR